MQIMIDIPEWKYKSICEGVEASKRCNIIGIDHNIHEAICNGTPLPKGHGRLIDVNEVKMKYPLEIDGLDLRGNNQGLHTAIDDASTIIEADEEEQHE